ncbi:MAG: hypothetical protein JJ992_22995 [Planctomycetes bacterium]|nr:hypothetical protein [Planctomycetota bacterium]
MTPNRIHNLSFVVMSWAIIACVPAFAGEPKENAGASSTSGLAQLLDLVGSKSFPSLSGLIQPERMGLLTDNECQMKDNEADLDLLSGNNVSVLSNLHILSGITVTVNIHVDGNGKGPCDLAANKSKSKPKSDKSRKSRKRKGSRRSRSQE